MFTAPTSTPRCLHSGKGSPNTASLTGTSAPVCSTDMSAHLHLQVLTSSMSRVQLLPTMIEHGVSRVWIYPGASLLQALFFSLYLHRSCIGSECFSGHVRTSDIASRLRVPFDLARGAKCNPGGGCLCFSLRFPLMSSPFCPMCLLPLALALFFFYISDTICKLLPLAHFFPSLYFCRILRELAPNFEFRSWQSENTTATMTTTMVSVRYVTLIY